MQQPQLVAKGLFYIICLDVRRFAGWTVSL